MPMRDDYIPQTIQWALSERLSIVVHPTDYTQRSTGTQRFCEPMPSVSHLRQREGESREQFIVRVSQSGDDESHYMTLATRAELQAHGGMCSADWLPTEDSFHPMLCPEGSNR